MSLVAEYGFNEGAGTTVADSSGNAYDLTRGANTHTSWVEGHTGSGLQGDGTLGAGTGATSATLANPTTGVTILGWVRPHTVAGAEMALLGFWDGGDPNGNSQFCLWATRASFSTPNILQGNYRIGTLQPLAGPALTADVWVHVALTYDGSNVRMYVDGVQYAEAAATGSLTAGKFGAAGHTDATVDDVRVFDTALSEAEITTWMNTPVEGSPGETRDIRVGGVTPVNQAVGAGLVPVYAGADLVWS